MNAQTPPDLVPGCIGKYEILELIAEGGMGRVYRARDPHLDREVALKLMLPGLDTSAIDRFALEARVLATLNHDNVVAVYSFDRPNDGPPFITMELLHGRSLSAAVTESRSLPAQHRIDIVRQALAGLAYTHRRGVIHRDIKPSNILLAEDGVVKIIDFGIARLADSPILTRSGIIGTPDYMSPEQTDKDAVLDGRSDLFSVGSVLYELFAGIPPFRSTNSAQTIYRINYEEPDYSQIAEWPALVPILRRALTKDVNRRYQSASEFDSDLAGLLKTLSGPTRPSLPGVGRSRIRLRLLWMLPVFLLMAPLRDTVQPSLIPNKAQSDQTSAPILLSDVPSAPSNDSEGELRPESPKSDAPAIDFHNPDSLKPALKLDIGGGEAIELVLVRAGSFLMGSSPGEQGPDSEGDEAQHRVSLSAPFYIGKYEVTNDQFEAVMRDRPDYFHLNQFPGELQPVENVTFKEAEEFCRLVSVKTNICVRLPTEAEWEFACRAGTTTRFNVGDGEGALANAAWYVKTSAAQTHPVGTKAPNGWGLYDMHGNVREWCQDWYGEDYYKKLPSAAIDPKGPATGTYRVSRGGSINSEAVACRCGYRGRGVPGQRSHERGFRVVISSGKCPENQPAP